MALLRFPDGFEWGVATASYQIEGAAFEDGRGLSIWDVFCRQPGTISDGSTGDVACDHYHRYRDDVALMASLGVQTYRFSIAWPRIFPRGSGEANGAGVAFYDRLVDALLEAGIAPCATLYHWDLPQSLQDRSGWANRETAERFAEYAAVMFERLGDRVDRWITHNEPWVAVNAGHLHGRHAPGMADPVVAAKAIHHILLSHGLAVQAFRASGRPGAIGITNANASHEPVDDSPEALEAVERARDIDTRLFHDPVYGRGYPRSVMEYYRGRGAEFPIEDGDLDVIATPTDFLGVNLYSRRLIEPAPDSALGFRAAQPTLPLLSMGYEAAPHALGDFVRWVSEEYGRPTIYVTENGVGDQRDIDGHGRIEDAERVALLRGFLAGLHGAIDDGADVRGYYLWSFMDNFEWAHGYTQRFGIVHVNYETLVRTPKASAGWYSGVIAQNGVEVE